MVFPTVCKKKKKNICSTQLCRHKYGSHWRLFVEVQKRLTPQISNGIFCYV